MSEEPPIDLAVIDPDATSQEWAQLDTTDWDPDIQEHVRRIKEERGIGVIASDGAIEVTEQDTTDEKPIAFIDSRGMEHRPALYAAECYASPDIRAAVSEYFTHFDAELAAINDGLDLVKKEEQVDYPKPFDPLNEDTLHSILKVAAEQLPGLTKEVEKTEPREVTVGRVFKHTETVYEKVTSHEPVSGYTSLPVDEKSVQTWRKLMFKPLRSEKHYNQEEISTSDETVQNALTDLLTSTEPSREDQIQHRVYDQKLPLLATRLRDKGIDPEAITKLSWDTVAELVPELTGIFSDIKTAVARQGAMATLGSLTSLEDRLRMLSPAYCETVARLYYSEEQLATLDDVGQRLMQLKAAPFAQLYPEQQMAQPENYGQSYVDHQRESIASFFDGALAADTLMVHGSHFAPRIIYSGFLKPAQAMSQEEFTFATDRNKTSGATINGSRSVHWASMADSSNYGYGPDFDAATMKRVVGENVSNLEQELRKGPIAAGRFAMRLGDIVQHAPFVGDGASDFTVRPLPRYGTVDLTPKGWQQVNDKLGDAKHISDIAYVATPNRRTSADPYQFAYPIEDMIIGIPSLDKAPILKALHERGWSDEQIISQTYIYRLSDSTQAVQDAVFAQPKFLHGIVVPISTEE
jgi:hypothetical protein